MLVLLLRTYKVCFMLDDTSEKSLETQYTKENREFLDSIYNDYANDIKRAEYIKGFLINLVFKSSSVLLTLYCLNIGVSLWLATLAGFSLGSAPGFKDVVDSGVAVNERLEVPNLGKFFAGIGSIILSVGVMFGSTTEYRQALHITKISGDLYRQDIEKYESPKSSELPTQLLWIVGGLGGVLALGLVATNNKD